MGSGAGDRDLPDGEQAAAGGGESAVHRRGKFTTDFGMAFGQSLGPPASSRQLKALLALLREAGHVDFRDARGPMGFTQRQAGGKFTSDEAEAFIRQLEADADPGADDGADPGVNHRHEDADDGGSGVQPRPKPGGPVKPNAEERAVRRLPDGVLAAELQRRGWIVMEP